MRYILRLLCLGAVLGCAGHHVTRQVVETANTLTTSWRNLSPLQQHFVLGYTQTQQGRFAEAIAHLQQIRGRYPLLEDYILYTLARAALGAGELELAEAAATAGMHDATSGPAQKANTLLIAVALARKQWDVAAARIQEQMRAAGPKGQREGLLQLAQLDLAKGDVRAAGQRYFELYRTAQYPDQIAAAKKGMREIERADHEDVLRAIPEHLRYHTARDFLSRGLAAEGARLLTGIAGVSPRELAEAYFRARDYGKAADLYARIVEPARSDIALLEQYATAAARAGRERTAIALHEQIIARGAPATSVERARAKRAFLLLDHGDYAHAAAAYREWLAVARRGGQGEVVRDALWAIAWAEYRQGHTNAALAVLAELEGAVGSDRLWRARIAYWSGRVYEAAKRRHDARAQFAQVVQQYSGSYYGRLGLARLQGRKGTGHLFIVARPKGHLRRDIAISPDALSPQAAELLRLGLWEEAIEATEQRGQSVLLPIHDAVIARFAAQWGLDADLVRRVMWQESGNRPQVVSPAGAIGLLQLMPATAAAMARELQLEDFRTADLYRPLPNLRLGMWYLRTLQERYDGLLPLMLASYNAGETAVDRWRERRADHDMEEYIETIPFDETRNYVRRILQMYW